VRAVRVFLTVAHYNTCTHACPKLHPNEWIETTFYGNAGGLCEGDERLDCARYSLIKKKNINISAYTRSDLILNGIIILLCCYSIIYSYDLDNETTMTIKLKKIHLSKILT
jgi:hypothetical protein